MGEPLARMDGAAEGLLAEAAHRLERALQTLEAVLADGRGVSAPPVGSTRSVGSAQIVELEAARRRGRELETAAAEASQALGRAVAQVRLALDGAETTERDAQPSLFDQGLLDRGVSDSPLESGPLTPHEEETEADDPAPEKEPTA